MDKRAVFRVYRKAFCRALPIVFKKEVLTDQGLPGYLYVLKDNFADPPDQNPDNECYCLNKKNCLKKGLINLTPCYYSTLFLNGNYVTIILSHSVISLICIILLQIILFINAQMFY